MAACVLQCHSVLGSLHQTTEEHSNQFTHVLRFGSTQCEVSFQRQQTYSLPSCFIIPSETKTSHQENFTNNYLLFPQEQPAGVDSRDFWEGELQQPLLPLIQECDSSPVYGHYKLAFLQRRTWKDNRTKCFGSDFLTSIRSEIGRKTDALPLWLHK